MVHGPHHEKVELGERALMTHYIQDVIDHRIGVAEFQVVDQDGQITFLIKEEQEADQPAYVSVSKLIFLKPVS